MLQVIIDKEIRDLLGSSKFVFTFSVCAVLILLSFYVGATDYRLSVERYEAAKAENLTQFEGLTNWMDARGHRIFLPPQPLGALVNGISNDIGRTIDVEARGELTAHGSRYNEDPVFAVFRFLDLEFIFQIVLSLFAILLGYDAISGEKERGTLKLTLSNAVPRATLILGKYIGLFMALSVSLLLAIGVGCLMLPALSVSLNASEWARLGLIVLSGLLYFGVFLSISLFVSATTRRTANSFLILLSIWVLAVMIIPRVAVLLAGRAVEVPSVDEIASKKGRFASELWGSFRDDLESFKPTPREDGDIEGMMNEFNAFMDSLSNLREGKMNEFATRLNEERYNRQRQQQAVAFNIARVSPAASLSLATSELAGTSLSLKGRYRDDAANYQKVYADFMREKTGMNVGGGMMIIAIKDGDEEEEPINTAELPVYTYTPPSLSETTEAALVDFGLLAIVNLIFFAAAFVAFGRYDAR